MIPNSDTAGPFRGSQRAGQVHRQMHIFIFTWFIANRFFAVHTFGGPSTNCEYDFGSVRAL
jgi:hypothetical protein